MMDNHHIENLNSANQNLKRSLLLTQKKLEMLIEAISEISGEKIKVNEIPIESLKKELSDLKSRVNKSRVNNSDRININKVELVEEIFEIFDKDFYLEKNEDIKESDLNPYEHFIRFGYKEGRLFFKNISKETEIKVIKDFNS